MIYLLYIKSNNNCYLLLNLCLSFSQYNNTTGGTLSEVYKSSQPWCWRPFRIAREIDQPTNFNMNTFKRQKIGKKVPTARVTTMTKLFILEVPTVRLPRDRAPFGMGKAINETGDKVISLYCVPAKVSKFKLDKYVLVTDVPVCFRHYG